MSDKNIMDEIVKYIKDYGQIGLEDIPQIDLYADQVTNFVEEKLEKNKRDKNDKQLTKSMINNYTKHKVIPPPIKKKYTKEQIALLMLICQLKSVLSINDIKSIFDEKNMDITWENMYKVYTMLKVNECENIEKDVEKKLMAIKSLENFENKDEKEELIYLALALAADAAVKKQMAERIIDFI